MENFEAINKQLMERIEAADFDEAMKKQYISLLIN